ncbi:MAG TPA: hypothetical protein VFJ98_03005 [Mycobacteriales bacterium]|nr:hypothetical protein [Mycobacteriales bacterium]
MPREVVALVSADDVVAAIRVHADRVHDLLRRSGCGVDESVEVCESYAFALIDAVVNAPETVGDMAGWWFGRALELGRRLGAPGGEPTSADTTSVLAGTSGEAQVRAALAALPEQERAAVLLRDGYDLPPQAVGVALHRDLTSTQALVAAGRLRLVSHYDDRAIPDLGGHEGRAPADAGTLAALADGTLPAPRVVALRRHLAGCTSCEDAVEMLAKGRRLAAALPVVAMPDDAREAMLERVTERAHAVLPSVEEVLLAIDEDESASPVVSPIAVILAIVLALVLGVAVAAVTTHHPGDSVALATPQSPAAVSPSFTVGPAPTDRSPSPRRHHSASPSATTTPSTPPPAGPSSTPTSAAAAIAAITIDPGSGPRGTTISVTGTGWTPGSTVSVRYSGALTGGGASATVDARGRFSATVTANAALPGSYTVTASDGSQSDSQPFRQTS